MRKQEEIKALSTKLARLVELFRKGEYAKNFEWWNYNSPSTMFYERYGYQNSQSLYDEVAQEILKLNSEMLSEYEVHKRLRFDFLVHQTTKVSEPDHLYNTDLIDLAIRFITELIEFKQWREIDIAILNLWPDSEPITLGRVTFIAITKEEIEKWKNKSHHPASLDDVKVVARVNSPGDEQKALSYARNEVSLVLDFIRAFCFPFGKNSDMWPVGMLGDFDASKQIPVRINNRDYITLVGPGIYNNKLREHILPKLGVTHWELLNKLILKNHYNDMERKLIGSIHWLAEGTKPDKNNAKFTKISFALETLLGGKPKDKNLKVRGITAMLAERAAFIAGKDIIDDRLAIDKDVRKYYRIRSKIVHGGKGEVTLEDIDNFGELVRRLALAMLEKLDEIGNEIINVDTLEGWVKQQRCTLGAS